MAFMDKVWLKDNKFIAGLDNFSLADISAYCEIM